MRSLLIASLFVLSFFPSSLLAVQDAAKDDPVQDKTAPPEQAEKVEREACKKVTCAFDVRIVLKQKDGSIFDKSYRALPVVQPSGVSVYAGQSVLFEADAQGDQLTNFKLVKSVEHPEKTISATLQQLSNGSMMLTLQNPFKRHIKIAMGAMPLDLGRLLKTSSCPVRAGLVHFEGWPYPIFQVWLGNIHFLKDSSEATCSE